MLSTKTIQFSKIMLTIIGNVAENVAPDLCTAGDAWRALYG